MAKVDTLFFLPYLVGVVMVEKSKKAVGQKHCGSEWDSRAG